MDFSQLQGKIYTDPRGEKNNLIFNLQVLYWKKKLLPYAISQDNILHFMQVFIKWWQLIISNSF